MEGWYYLHTNGALIYKRELGDMAADIRESTFARSMWPFDPTNREGAWRILIEATALDVIPARIAELAEKWGCDDKDAAIYAERVGCNPVHGWRSMVRHRSSFREPCRVACGLRPYGARRHGRALQTARFQGRQDVERNFR